MMSKIMLAAGAIAMVAATSATPAAARSAEAYCRDVALEAAHRGSNGDVLAGTVGGAAAGALLGAIIGHGKGSAIGKGAIIGGVGGTALSAINLSSKQKRRYERAYWRCMQDMDTGYGQPQQTFYEPSDRDVQYCMAKYRSYNPRTGMYLSYSGQYRPCP